jgi:hypothetical protein
LVATSGETIDRSRPLPMGHDGCQAAAVPTRRNNALDRTRRAMPKKLVHSHWQAAGQLE